jgi:hypothetical protein
MDIPAVRQSWVDAANYNAEVEARGSGG